MARDGLLAFTSKINSGHNLSVGFVIPCHCWAGGCVTPCWAGRGLLQVLELHSLSYKAVSSRAEG